MLLYLPLVVGNQGSDAAHGVMVLVVQAWSGGDGAKGKGPCILFSSVLEVGGYGNIGGARFAFAEWVGSEIVLGAGFGCFKHLIYDERVDVFYKVSVFSMSESEPMGQK